MEVEIVGLPKSAVLLWLYNYAKGAGPAIDSITQRALSMAPTNLYSSKDAEEYIKAKKDTEGPLGAGVYCFDYVNMVEGGLSKPIGVDISGFAFDAKKYDDYHGVGQAQKAINDLMDHYINNEM